MSCCNTYNPCKSNNLSQVSSYAATAGQYAQQAQQSATNAATSATQASTAEAQAEQYAIQAAASAAISGIYLGAKSTAPVVDNQGNPLQEGMQYFNTVDNTMYVWDGTSWITATGFNETTNFLAAGTTAPRNLVTRMADVVNVLDFGADPTGAIDSTDEIQAALNSTATEIYFPPGNYRIVDVNQNGTAALISSVPNRVLSGPGRITATTPVYKALQVSGNNSRIHLNFAGNNQIMVALVVTGDGCEVSGSSFFDLYSPANTYQAIGIWADFDGGDKCILVTGNIFRNIQAIGDNIGGNGTGLSRAVSLGSDQNITKSSIVSNNIIENVTGEEGDSIIVISSNGAGIYYDFPVLISGNTITTWNRRAIKIQSNKATIRNNCLRNTYLSPPSGIQPAISLVQGGDHLVDGNLLDNCRYAGQIVLISQGVLERFDNITIINNCIRNIGVETNNTAIFISSYGENVIVANNSINAPNHNATNNIVVANALSGYVSGNFINTTTSDKYNFTNSVNLLLDVDSTGITIPGGFTLANSGDAFGINVLGSTQKSLTLYNFDSTLSDGEIVSRIQFHQNDLSNPNSVHASIRAEAVGSSGSLSLVFCTGGSSTADTPRVRIGTTGNITPEVDNTQNLGSASLRWNTIFAGSSTIDTSDEREKQDIESLNAAEKRVAVALKGLIKKFRFKDAVQSKGDAARIHVGVIAQEVQAAFNAEGLDPFTYGLLCYDEWDAQPEVVGENGEITQRYRPAGNRYGVRYDELLAFIISAL